MAHHALALLACLVAANWGFAVTIISAKQLGNTQYIKIDFSHAGSTRENKFQFRFDEPREGPESGLYTGHIVRIESPSSNLNGETETFLIFDLAGKVKTPCSLRILSEDESSSYILGIEAISPAKAKTQAQTRKNRSKKPCIIF